MNRLESIPAFFRKIYKYKHSMHLRHPSGNYLDLHWNLLPFCFGSAENEDFWDASRPSLFNARPVRTLDPADQLLHICVHGAAWNSLSHIRWIADAVIVIRATPDLNWERLLRQAEKRKLTLMVRGALNYIDRHFDGLVPAAVLSEIARTKVTFFEKLEYSQIIRSKGSDSLTGGAGNSLLRFWRISKSKTMGNQSSFKEFLCAEWSVTENRQLPLMFLDKSWHNFVDAISLFSTRRQRSES
jgi:Uncharacterised nucleotidyltransferase